MPVIQITDSSQWINISSGSGITGSLVITNCSSHPLYAIASATQPAASSLGVLCREFEEVFLQNPNGNSIWVKMSLPGPVLVQSAIGASAQYSVSALPPALLTSGPEGYQRLRVDNSETSFFLGQSFRTFFEYSLAAGASQTFRFDRLTDVIIQTVETSVEGGSVKLEIYRGSTPTGTWSTALPIISKNEMTTVPAPAYVSQATITSGGTISGGTLRDIVRIVAPSATAQQISTGSTSDHNRGVAPTPSGYYRLTNFGNSPITGVFKIEWEERP